VDPADDWSGDEPAIARARRRAEFWPQVVATGERGLFAVWGILLAFLLILEIWLGWSLRFSLRPGWEPVWGLAVALSVVGAWLAFYLVGEMDVELEDDPGPAIA
jgi:hypothetical protein